MTGSGPLNPGSFKGCIYNDANTGIANGVCDVENGYFKSWADGEVGMIEWTNTEDAYCIEAAYLSGQ